MKNSVFIFLSLLMAHWCMVFAASAGEALVFQKGAASIRGLLPDAWREMTSDERQGYLRRNDEIMQSAGVLLSAFQRQGEFPGAEPVLFVFHAAADQRVTAEQREKIYAWFEKNRAVALMVAPVEVKSLSLENIEYLHDRDTIIFDTSVEVGGQKLHGVSGIIFLEQGYLNIIGYENDGAKRYRGDFDAFIKTLSIPKEFKYSSKKDAYWDFPWLVAHWQQATGVLLFLLVYGLVFLQKEKRLPPS